VSKVPLVTEAFVLNKECFEENYYRLDLFSQELGKISCLQRLRKVTNQLSLDFFDKASFNLKPSTREGLFFVNETHLIYRHQNIGKSYHALYYSSMWAKALAKNLQYLESFSYLYELSGKAFTAWEGGLCPEVIYFKSLFLMINYEGYPVREDWWKSLAVQKRQIVSRILKNPLKQQVETATQVVEMIELLTQWTEGCTAIVL